MLVDLPLSVPGGSLAHVAEVAIAAERQGFDGVSYSELSSDPILHLTVAAGATERIELMTNIVVAFARTPMLLAVQGRALQDYSGGRLSLGLGSQIKPHIERRFSMPWSSPAARMVEFISAMRAIWESWETGDKLDFRGDFYTHTLMTPMFTPPTEQPAPKILLAAVGEGMTEAAGAVADGLIIHPFSTARYVSEVTLPAVERGRTSDRPFEIYSSAFIISGRTEEELAESEQRSREQIAFYGSTPAYRGVLELHGWGELADDLNRLSKSADPDKWVRMGELITDEVLAEFAVSGEPEVAAARHVERWGRLITRYAVNNIAIEDPDIAAQVGRAIKAAAA